VSTVSLDQLYRQARADFPEVPYLRFRRLPNTPESAVEISLENREEWRLAYYDPYSGKLLGVRNARKHFLGWLLGLHYSLLSGKTGELLVGVLAVALFLSVLTGTMVYRKHLFKVLFFRERLKFSNWRTGASTLHRFIGVWSLVFNLMFAITGFWMLRYVFLPATYIQHKESVRSNAAFSVSLDTLYSQAGATIKSFSPSGIYLPTSPTENITFYGKVTAANPIYNEFANSIEFDPQSGKVVTALDIRNQTFSEKWDMMAYPLHAGHFGNLLVKIFYCTMGLTPAFLSLTGFLLCFRRKRKKSTPKKQNKQLFDVNC
jgi:uncharacterized iron-regulated membrane protein